MRFKSVKKQRKMQEKIEDWLEAIDYFDGCDKNGLARGNDFIRVQIAISFELEGKQKAQKKKKRMNIIKRKKNEKEQEGGVEC